MLLFDSFQMKASVVLALDRCCHGDLVTSVLKFKKKLYNTSSHVARVMTVVFIREQNSAINLGAIVMA